MIFNIFEVASYLPARCGIGTYTQDSVTELQCMEEVNSVSVAAIDSSKGRITYNSPVDKRTMINAYDLASWNKAAIEILGVAHSREYPTVVILQHEFGLDKTSEKNAYQHIAKIFKEAGKDKVVTLVNLHTVLKNPSEANRRSIKELSELVDGITIPAKIGVDILSSDIYGIPRSKLKHIDHGIRMENIGDINPEEVKNRYGLEGRCIITTPGLKSTGKGLEFGIKAYGKLINTHFSENSAERKKLVYLIAGEYHPGFIANSPDEFKKCQDSIQKAIDEFNLKSLTIKNIEKLSKQDAEQNDIIILEKFLDESLLKEIYAVSDMILLPYRNIEQISSGNLAEAVGFGKPVIATEFAHAVELLNPADLIKAKRQLKSGQEFESKGLIAKLKGKYKNIPDVDKLEECLEFLVFNERARVQIGINARKSSYDTSWPNVTRELIQYIGPILEARFEIKSNPVIVRRDNEVVENKTNGNKN